MMTQSHSSIREVVDVRSGGSSSPGAMATLLAKTSNLEVRRLNLVKGREIPTHQANGEITVHCLEGHVAFTTHGITQNLAAGQLIIVPAEEPHSLVALEDALILVTKIAGEVSTPA